MPVPVSSCNHSDTNAPAMFKPTTVVGMLAIPALTHIQPIHSSTSLADAIGDCLDILDEQYRSLFGLNDEIELEQLEILTPIKWDAGMRTFTPCSDVRTDESPPSKLYIYFRLSDHQSKSLKYLVPDYKDKVSSSSTEALLLHEIIKSQGVNTSEAVNSGKKRRKSNTSRSPPLSPVRPCFPQNEEGVELSIDDLKLENATMKSEQVRLQKNAEIREAKITALERELKTLTSANKTMSHALGLHIAKLHALHRRVLLDLAREKLLERYPTSGWTSGYKLAEALISRRAADDREDLPDKAVRMVCSGTLREDGNVAAHHATFDDLSQSALDASLIQSERDMLKNIFVYVLGQEPVLL